MDPALSIFRAKRQRFAKFPDRCDKYGQALVKQPQESELQALDRHELNLGLLQACMRGSSLAAALLLLSLSAISLAAEDATTANLGATAAGDGAAVVGNAIDTNTNPTKEAAQSTEAAKSGEELTEAVEANSEAQDYNEKTKPVKAQVVKQEPAAMLASGTGDLDTTGDLPALKQMKTVPGATETQ